MDIGSTVFITAGPNPRMRGGWTGCPMVEIDGIGDPRPLIEAIARGARAADYGTACDRQVMLFYKNIGVCPVHGIVYTPEPWTEGVGGVM